MEHIVRLFKPSYLPTNQDILRTRLRTTGICESLFNLGNYTYRMVDVGGQRSERKKWIHAFDNVQAVLFVAAISGYDQVLVEDRHGVCSITVSIRTTNSNSSQNQMEEALMLFEEIANSPYFKKAAQILFLNKIDLLQEKLQSNISPIRRYYSDFTGNPTDILAGQKFFADKFKRIHRVPNGQLFIHFTNATDKKLMKMTMTSVDNMILHRNLSTHIL
jgi:guanine nucleotide-binding protein subunit alpha